MFQPKFDAIFKNIHAIADRCMLPYHFQIINFDYPNRGFT